MKREKLNKKDKIEMIRYTIVALVFIAITTAFILVSVVSDKECNENHNAEFCRQQ